MANKIRQINTEIPDRPDPDWLDPPRPCGHEWRNNDFICMDCVEARIATLEQDLTVARAATPPVATPARNAASAPCKICGALPDVDGTPVEDCDSNNSLLATHGNDNPPEIAQ